MNAEELNILAKFDMTSTGCLVMVSDLAGCENVSEILALSVAESFGATAVYFRRTIDNSMSKPLVYIYDEDSIDRQEINDIHKDLWSSGVVPLFYIVSNTSLKIYNCHKSLQRVGRSQQYISKPIDTFDFESEVIEQFRIEKYSSNLFDTGVFWENNSELIHFANSPYQKLLKGLENAKKYLKKQETGLSDYTINKLLIIGILLRYLEEKEDEYGTKLLEVKRDLIDQFPNSNNFVDILRNGQLVSYLKELNRTLNGNLFNLTPIENTQLQETNLEHVAAVFDGTLDGGQYVLWKLYSFNKLPIELISSVYEAFLTKDKSIVYTPPYLANTLIDECMPLYKSQELFSDGNFKVLDPSCGSGIFLVAAFKRMVEWQALNNYKKTGELEFPDVSELKKILKNNIFGVDIKKGATLISMFSLNITLCEKLTPMEVWDKLKFENLSEANIFTDNFFSYYNDCEKGQFDLVIGNPPFNPPKDENGKEISNGDYLRSIIEEYDHVPNKDINDHNLALIFHDKTRDLVKNSGQQCLILPSSAFIYNSKSTNYRNRYFSDNTVSKVYDFTHLSDRIFINANIAVVGVVASKSNPNEKHELKHVVVKRSSVAEQRFYFEIDHYDIHKMNLKFQIDFPFIWKINLLGGGRLVNLVKYINCFDSLKDYLLSKKDDGWKFGEGYQITHDGAKSETELLSKGYSKAEWLTDKDSVLTESFTEKSFNTERETNFMFRRPGKRKKDIFKPPHILVKGNLGKNGLPVHFVDKYLTFKDKITGIHAPREDEHLLKQVFSWLKSNPDLLRFIVSITSTRAGVTMSSKELLSRDILALPYPDGGEISLSKSEKVLIGDVLKYGIKSKQSINNSPYEITVEEENLTSFGELFCDALDPIYATETNTWFTHSYKIEKEYTAYAFCYGNKSKWNRNILDLQSKSTYKDILRSAAGHIKYTRIIRKYLHIDGFDMLVLIKPSTIRYWLGSIALRDADETFSDLKRIGK